MKLININSGLNRLFLKRTSNIKRNKNKLLKKFLLLVSFLPLIAFSKVYAADRSYGVISKNCGWKFNPHTPTYSWDLDFFCIDGSPSAVVQAFNFKNAILVADAFPEPIITVTDGSESPLVDGIPLVNIQFVRDDNVTNEINLLYPAPPGKHWIGYKSVVPMPPPQNLDTSYFKIHYEWRNMPNCLQNTTGAFWFSDNSDDLYGTIVFDAYNILGAFSPPVTNCPPITPTDSVPTFSQWGLIIFFMGIFLLAIGRFLLDFLREDMRWLGLNLGQYFSLAIIIIAGIILLKYYRKSYKSIKSD